MSSSSSHATITYTSVATDSDLPPWGFYLIKPEAPESVPKSPQEAPPSHVPAPAYPEYLAPSNDEVPVKDQLLPTDASPTIDSPGYIVDSKPIKDDFKEDPKMDPIEYNVDEEEEEPSNDEEEEEHLALADSALLVPDFVPSSEETEPFETDESAATPPSPPVSPHSIVPFSQTCL
ncbi:hypothetical protein Tco_0973892 [Tanacetum coccineum]|uniref:Uncharacterized protein n=1 Tax=Tanacetum coccineum TaxID=301880 RepID=A0ABQ5EA46_9ASTR